MTNDHLARRTTLVATVVLATFMLTGCGDDDDGAAAVDASAYCEQAAALETADQEPTGEQLDRLVQAAPDEIGDDVQAFVDAATTGDYGPEIEEAEARLLAFEEQHCGDTFGGDQELDD